jgi:hypothetical protein
MKKAIVLSIFSSFFLFSCGKKTIVCQNPGVLIACVGFTASDFNQGAILYRYKKDNAFDSLVDTNAAINRILYSDTLFITAVTNDSYDYKLSLTGPASTYNITSINYGGSKTQQVPEGIGSGGKAYTCFTHVASYTVNSTVYTRPENRSVYFTDTIFVHK